jgi:predicted nuclease of predicted toxin-antitoxin system
VRILFDECMPQPLRRLLKDFEISTAQEMGWGRVKNRELLKKAEGVFDAFVTADQNLKYQQIL